MRIRRYIFLGLFLAVLTISLFPVSSMALDKPPLENLKFSDVEKILATAVSWLYTVFLVVAVIFIIIAAFRYLFSGGDPAGVKSATKALVYAAVAIAVAMTSLGVSGLIKDFLGASGGSNPSNNSNPHDPCGLNPCPQNQNNPQDPGGLQPF